MECGKVQYGSKKVADDDIARIKIKSNRSTIPIRSYLCKCGFWHLTSKELRPQAKIDERIKQLNRRLAENQRLLSEARKSNSELIARIIKLEKQIEK